MKDKELDIAFALSTICTIIGICIIVAVIILLYRAWFEYPADYLDHEQLADVLAFATVAGARGRDGATAFDINITVANKGASVVSVKRIDVVVEREEVVVYGRARETRVMREVVGTYKTEFDVPPQSAKTATVTFYRPPHVSCVVFELLVVKQESDRTYTVRTERLCFTTEHLDLSFP